jgi:hypothetical protein
MNKTYKELVLLILKDLIGQIQATDATRIEALMCGEARLEFRIVSTTKEPTEHQKLERSENFEKNAAETLHGLSTREEGDQYIESICRSKEDLIRIARYLDLPVQKKETIKQIKDKIIEFTIGFRVRSAAVQGKSMEAS